MVLWNVTNNVTNKKHILHLLPLGHVVWRETDRAVLSVLGRRGIGVCGLGEAVDWIVEGYEDIFGAKLLNFVVVENIATHVILKSQREMF